ncbi:T9SS type A sorting domain-containing protein [candidate division WOR-3 bacterium]|nr:T9SS type A sorting domain-containing protein [candidate division WOR-3 bacterium]
MMHNLTRNSIIFYLLLTSCCLLLFAYPPGWSDDILLTPETPGYRLDPDISVDESNNVWVVWDSTFWGSTGYVYYTKRDSLGNCLIPETVLPDSDASNNGHVKVAIDAANNVHIQWTEPSVTGEGIGYAKLDNSGSLIVNPHLAMPGYGTGESCNRHAIALDKYKNIHVIWDEQPLESNQISYTKLDSLGDTLIGRIRVSPVGVYAIWPGIGVDSFANCHLGYRLAYTSIDSLAYTKIDKDGNILISNKILDAGTLPSIVADRSQNIHMVYPSNPTGYAWSIRYLKLDQNGNFLVAPKTIFNGFGAVHMAIDSLQYLHVVWDPESSGVQTITYTKLDTLGNFVIPPMQIVYPPYSPGGGAPRIAVDKSNRLHLVWVDGRLDPGVTCDIFYKRGENETTVREIKKLRYIEQDRIKIYPNPFSDVTRITFLFRGIEHSFSPTDRLEIYEITGRQVKTFASCRLAGTITWEGTDDHNIKLPNGVYFIRFTCETGQKAVSVIKLQ